ncbi:MULTISPECIES: hypothetical protein [unclassified Rathayibacter]|uniref:hypothetical protein n=1 Tax=unclassified Rathayibacter TaxID=2609250 RepID=UPI0006F791DF|nr:MULTISPECIES: hypothetical protein [unclassified Rathayibacter]KQQ05672.1 hypothetical protein ASF42_03670 [Rathayibacter sp. Leaf294]KQS13531.1 hypothetical protein ASG06_03680 [Rathayibacter sp. Leaf185]
MTSAVQPARLLVAVAVLALTGCSAGEVTVDATVLDTGSGPVLCRDLILQSSPPQCEGSALRGWDWDAVEGATTVDETTWGEYAVTGTWDGGTFVVSGPPEENGGNP